MQAPLTPRPGRRVKLILAVSLALNLLFVGLFAGAALRHGGGKGGPGGPLLRSYGAPYMQALPRADRKALNAALRQAGAIPNRKARAALYGEVLAGLRVNPFDSRAVADLMAKQQATVTGVQQAAQGAWIKIVSDMSPTARAAYADALEQRLQQRGGRHRHKKGEK